MVVPSCWARPAVSALPPAVPKASVECTIAHFFLPSVLTPYSAMTLPEYESFGRKRNNHWLPMCVSVGSVPPIITGLPIFSTSGAIACTCVERIEPRKPTMSVCDASLENASTMPGFVVWSSSTTSSTCFPSTPPALFTASIASLAPICAYLPDSAAGPVTGAHMPILMVAPCAHVLPTRPGNARLAVTAPERAPENLRREMVMSSSWYAGAAVSRHRCLTGQCISALGKTDQGYSSITGARSASEVGARWRRCPLSRGQEGDIDWSSVAEFQNFHHGRAIGGASRGSCCI